MIKDNSAQKRGGKKDFLQIIANTIVCNLGMTQEIGLTKGKMGISLFLYKYAKKSGIKEYESTANLLLDEIINNLYKSMDKSVTDGLAGIGIGLITLLSEGYVEDTDENDSLDEVDNLLFQEIVKKDITVSDFFSSAIYFIHRCTRYRAGLNVEKCLQLAKAIKIHLQALETSTLQANPKDVIAVKYILSNVENIISTLDKTALLRDIELQPFQDENNDTDMAKLYDVFWYELILNGTFRRNYYKLPQETNFRKLYSLCFYDVNRVFHYLIPVGLSIIN